MTPQYIEIAETPNPLCWWSNRLGEKCEVLEYIPKTEFYRIRVNVEGFDTWGGIPVKHCKSILREV